MKKYNLKDIFFNKNFRSHLSRVFFPYKEMEVAWVDEKEYHENFLEFSKRYDYKKYNKNKNIILTGNSFDIEEKNGDLYFYNEDGVSKLMEDPLFWLTEYGVEKEYSKLALSFFIEYYLNKKKYNTEDLVLLKLIHSDNIGVERNTPFYIALNNKSNLNNIDKLKKLIESDDTEYLEDDLIEYVKTFLSEEILFILTSYEQYEDLMKSINCKHLYLFNDNLIEINKEDLNIEDFNPDYKEYSSYLNKFRLEDY